MIYLKSDREIEKMRKSAQLVSHTLAEVSKYIEPGIETGKLDVIAEDFVKKHGARPALKGMVLPQTHFLGHFVFQ